MEDLDHPRVVPGCADDILRTLDSFGFEWDGDVLYQSKRNDAYRDAIATLRARGLVYECSCSRKELADTDGPYAHVYPGTCRRGPTKPGPTATRARVETDATIEFDDAIQGRQSVSLAGCGDVIVRRRDNVIAYQLAVVVDDAFQGVTDVVRGCDLLASTPWQIALQSALALPGVSYAHLPVITEPGGEKLAKSRRSVALDAARVSSQLCHALELLQQTPPPALAAEPPARVWDWARRHWRPHVLQGISCVQLSPHGDSF